MTRFLFLIATILSAATSVNSQTVAPTLSPTAVTEPKRDNGLLAAVVIITSVIILGMCCWLGCSIRYNKQHCCRTGSCVNADEIKNKKGDYEGDNDSDDGHEDPKAPNCCQRNCYPITPTQQDNCQPDNSCQLCGCCVKDPLAQPFCCFDTLCACDPKSVEPKPESSDDAKCQDECKC